jgi:TolA-binding protein
MTRSTAEEDGLDTYAQGVVALLKESGDADARPAAVRRQPFRMLSPLIARREARARSNRIVAVGLGCALIATAIGVGARSRFGYREPDVLTFTLDGQPVPTSTQTIAPSARAPALSFSDGTRIRMAPGARGRVVELTKLGGRIALDDGNAHVHVAPRPSAHWTFEAGPFLVVVHGTTFSLGWDLQRARFDIQMDEGVVSVSGPVTGGEIVLHAGEKLSVSVANALAAATTPADGARSDTAPLEEPAPVAALERPGVDSGERRSPARWTGWVVAGRAKAVIADARRVGLDWVLERSSGEELAALASAARYQNEDELARRVLLTQRRRFPHSARAAEASFLLGRLDDESRRDPASALTWYERYLDEAPRGEYVSEALGRKMVVLERTHREAEAAAIARDYVRRFPAGTYAHAAKALLRQP